MARASMEFSEPSVATPREAINLCDGDASKMTSCTTKVSAGASSSQCPMGIPEWPCKACTYRNPRSSRSYEACGADVNGLTVATTENTRASSPPLVAWRCKACTCHNLQPSRSCQACGADENDVNTAIDARQVPFAKRFATARRQRRYGNLRGTRSIGTPRFS